MLRFATPLIAALALCALVRAAHAGAEVVDGDGLHLGSERIRLWGIDAPELDQKCKRGGASYPCGQQARAALAALVAAGEVRCERVNHDRYGRTVARCSVEGRDLGAEMVRLGWAVDFPRYSEGFYREQERDARKARRGVWADGEFMPPVTWRRQHRPIGKPRS